MKLMAVPLLWFKDCQKQLRKLNPTEMVYFAQMLHLVPHFIPEKGTSSDSSVSSCKLIER